MKKIVLIMMVLLIGLSSQAFAATGSANDGLILILVIAGFLLLVAGVLSGIDYFQVNGKMLIHRFNAFVKSKISVLKRVFGNGNSEFADVKYF